jgi:hypothetical protein
MAILEHNPLVTFKWPMLISQDIREKLQYLTAG